MAPQNRSRTVYLETLGCAKNSADSDGILSIMRNAGFAAVEASRDADVVIVNTCGFLQSARAEALRVLRELADAKQDGQILIAAGCLISRYGTRVRQEIPALDGIIDAGRWPAMPRLVEHLQEHSRQEEDWLSEALPNLPQGQLFSRSVVQVLPRRAAGPSAYLKIADGCDRPCTFCIIPAIKGGHRSKPIDQVLSEARDLADQGIKELVLVAQDTTAYGWDLGQKDLLATLLERLDAEIEGIHWVRLMYAYPGHVTPRLIKTMARLPRVAHYIDVPLQHAHPAALTRMKRPNEIVTRRMLDDLRAAIPDIAIRTTFIVGFPGETKDEFRDLLRFIEEQQFDRVGIFEYSREEGTPANAMPGQVNVRTKRQRRARAMLLQQGISEVKNKAWVGRALDVLIEGSDQGVSIGRSYRDAPEVDGLVLVHGDLPKGALIRVRVNQAHDYDLEGIPDKVLEGEEFITGTRGPNLPLPAAHQGP